MARKLAFDRVLFATVALMVGLGLVMVYSASAVLARQGGYAYNPYFLKQGFAAIVGFAGMLLAMYVDYRKLRQPLWIYALLAAVLALLLGVLFAPTLNNTRRWFFVGPLSIQPSELAKLALIPYIAYQIEKKSERINSQHFLIPCVFVTMVMVVLIMLGRDLGTAMLLTIPAFLMVFLAGLSWRFLAVGGVMILPLTVVAVLLEPYRMQRLLAFRHPESDPLGSGFQVLQSLIAVGSGGVLGLGPGNSVQKLHFLPSPHADFIYSIVAEELGLLGAVLVLALFGILLWRGLRAGERAPDPLGRYLCWGFISLLVAQALIHVSVALALLPTTGVPLPFISHGGSSLVTSMVACGVVLNVSQHG